LNALSLAWRGPLAVGALAFAWRKLGRLRIAVAAIALAALAIDAVSPRLVDATAAARRLREAIRHVQASLGRAAGAAELQGVLVPGGAEARPELPFEALTTLADRLPGAFDSVVLVDERAAPVAWVGTHPTLPLRLRLLGERTVVGEAGYSAVWLWWREPLYDAGRPHGALLVGLATPEVGARRLLGVWAGRAGVLLPRLEGGADVQGPAGERLFGVDSAPAAPVFWSAPGGASALAALAMLVAGAVSLPIGLAGLLPIAVGAGPSLGVGWLLALTAAALAWALGKLPPTGWARVVAVAALASAAVGLFEVGRTLAIPLAPHGLLWPGVLPLAVLWGLTGAVRAAPGPSRANGWLMALAWLVAAVALARAEIGLLVVGVALAVAWGRTRRGVALAALVASLIIVVSQDALERDTLVADVDATMERLDNVETEARAFLGALPQSGLVELATLSSREQLVVLGRLARWFNLDRALPGCSLVVVSPDGYSLATWGEVAPPHEPARVLARRPLADGGWMEVTAPPEPHEALAALSQALDHGPAAVFGRSGAPVARGATFRPLSSDLVGRALAGGESWGTVGVGERDLPTYLRSWGDVVVAVPWVRRPLPETLLLLTALSLWGALPFTLPRWREGWHQWWNARRSLTGRLRALAVAIVMVPLMLLGYLLPRQWSRQTRQNRLDLARIVSEPLARPGWEHDLGWLIRELGGVVTVYRAGVMVLSTHPDEVVRGEVPWLAPRDSYVRAVRGWFEPLVEGERETRVFTAVPDADVPTVVAVTGLRQATAMAGSTPVEWFVVTGVVGLLLALAAARWLGDRIARPLRHLLEAAGRLERGETVERIEGPADDEVEVLASAFETMARTVRGREEELRRERDLLGEVLGTLSAAVAVWRIADGSFELLNPSAEELLRSGRSLDALVARFGAPFAALRAAAGEERRASGILRPLRGEDALWRATVVPLTGARALLVMEDLSDVARAERLASLAELARIVAHEVKNPLTPIRLWAEELQAALDRGPEAVAAVAEVAAEQILGRVRHLHDVAQGFSNLVALERWEPEEVSLADLARDVGAEYAVLGQRAIAIETRVSGDTRVEADPGWLRRALRHLLENSVRAIGHGAGTITIEVDAVENGVELAVSDTGGGVAEEHLPRLFEPHFSTTTDGSGLGLAVVDRVVRRAGGRVYARNVAGGLEVRLHLPASPRRS
jgi:signal transduction histidine kinase/HAMP domain-containing protein